MGIKLPLIQEYLQKQQDLRAVTRFAALHDEGSVCAPNGVYEAQIPLSAPGPGQQYAFRVDLDACTGCKACVVGCNRLNGLDGDEAWRAVGTLHGGGGRANRGMQQTITTACHHCLDPGCMKGCPVGAYEKDPKTGIVRHLDDQCIGCQYCTLTCPYEVPQYNERLGIVRKCDMCTDRLGAGEAPACVQSCPNGAIAITLVDVPDVRAKAETGALVPGAPESRLTAPTTIYHTKREGEAATLPADYYAYTPADPHLPLVVLLVLSQLSVGVFVLETLLGLLLGGATLPGAPIALLVGALSGMLGLMAAPLHLGRPLYAFRAFIGFRTSWMSREAVFLGLYGGLALAAAGLPLALDVPLAVELAGKVGLDRPGLDQLARDLEGIGRMLVPASALLGTVAVVCSAMLYVVTGRRFWGGWTTHSRFFGTALLLGSAVLACAAIFAAPKGLEAGSAKLAFGLLIGATLFKLGAESTIIQHQDDTERGELWRSAELITGPLFNMSTVRTTAGVLGGIALPGLLLVSGDSAGPTALRGLAVASLGLCLVGEFLERVLFFMAVAPLRMPGGFGKVSRA